MKAHHTAEWISEAFDRTTMIDAATSWLGAKRWDWFVSLTFADSPNRDTAERALRGWLRFLAAELFHGHIPYVVGAAFDDWSRPHFHVLLALPRAASRLDVDTAKGRWGSHGLADIRVFDPHEAAVRYLLSHPAWDVNVACTRANRCRRSSRGCLEAPGPWR